MLYKANPLTEISRSAASLQSTVLPPPLKTGLLFPNARSAWCRLFDACTSRCR